jgi:geranylgeranylglycerol-phosphate geranylgeranyltransferase
VLGLGAVIWGIARLYNIIFKEYGIADNLIVAFCVGMTVVLGGVIAGTINGVVLTFAALAFFLDLGEDRK